MSNQPVNALLAVYSNRAYADSAVTYLSRIMKSDLVHVDGIAIVTKDLNGDVVAEEQGEPTGKRGAGRGALLGAAVGVIFPPSIIATSIAGAGIGGVIGHVRGRSDTHAALQAMGERLDRGHAGVIVVVGDQAVDQVIARLTGCEALYQERVDPDTLAILEPEDTSAAQK
jgi:uncharacterized membrane protein